MATPRTSDQSSMGYCRPVMSKALASATLALAALVAGCQLPATNATLSTAAEAEAWVVSDYEFLCGSAQGGNRIGLRLRTTPERSERLQGTAFHRVSIDRVSWNGREFDTEQLYTLNQNLTEVGRLEDISIDCRPTESVLRLRAAPQSGSDLPIQIYVGPTETRLGSFPDPVVPLGDVSTDTYCGGVPCIDHRGMPYQADRVSLTQEIHCPHWTGRLTIEARSLNELTSEQRRLRTDRAMVTSLSWNGVAADAIELAAINQEAGRYFLHRRTEVVCDGENAVVRLDFWPNEYGSGAIELESIGGRIGVVRAG